MPGIDRDLVQLRHDAIDAKRLIPQHLRLYNFAYRILRRAFRAHTGQILRRHISALPVRAGDLVPVDCGLFQHDDLRSLFVFSENPILRSRPGAQPQRVAPGGTRDRSWRRRRASPAPDSRAASWPQARARGECAPRRAAPTCRIHQYRAPA